MCVPAVNAEVESVAAPLEKVPTPRDVAPSRKFTVPVGVPSGEEIVAVRSTTFCTRTGLMLEDSSMAAGVALAMTRVPMAVPV